MSTDRAREYIKAVRSAKTSGSRSAIDALLADDKFNAPIQVNTTTEKEANAQNGLGSRILDILSRPLYAAGNVVEASFAPTGKNLFTEAWEGFSGQDKTTPGDVVKEQFPDAPWGAGLAADLILDPLNFVGLKAPTALARARQGKEAATLVADEARKFVSKPEEIATASKVVNVEPLTDFTPRPQAKPVKKDDFLTAMSSLRDDINKATASERIALVTSPVTPVVKADRAPDIARVVNATTRYAEKELGHGNFAQAYGLVEAVRIAAERAANLKGKARQAFMRQEVTEILGPVREGLSAQGVPQYITDGTKRYPLSDLDAIEILDPKIVDEHLFTPTRKIQPTQISAGIAAVIDGAPDVNAVVKAMWRNGGRKGTGVRPPDVRAVAQDIVNKREAFIDRVATNRARLSVKHEEDAPKLTAEVIRQIHSALQTKSTASITEAVAKIDNIVDDAAKAVGAQPITAAQGMTDALREVDDLLGWDSLDEARSIRRVVNDMAVGTPRSEIIKKVNTRLKKVEKNSIEEARKIKPSLIDDEKFSVGMYMVQNKLLEPFKRRSDTQKNMLELLRGQGAAGLAGADIGDFNRGLNALQKYPTDDIVTEFSNIRLGKPAVNQEISELLSNSLSKMFDLSEDGNGLYGTFFRNNGNVDLANKAMERAGLLQRFKDGPDDWRGWVVDDPIDFLSRTYDATRKMTANQTVAVTLENNFASVTRKSGYVKLSVGEDSLITPHLNTSLWYPPETAEAIQYLEWAAGYKKGFKGSSSLLGQAVDKVYDPILTIWKTYMTIVRPGHHFRNFVGDGMLNHLRGMNNIPKWYRDAFAVIRNGGADYKINIDGATVSGDELYRLFRQNGLRPNYHTAEDILQISDKGRVEKAIMNNRYVEFMGEVSEKFSAEGRFAQFLWEMSRPINGAKDINHKAAIVARRVRRWHPDAGGLSPAEAKYARRAIPFYSWLRQAIPLVAEATITRPGRVIALPKAAYNYALSNGVDPSSLSDPFPETYPYPSFIKDNLLGPLTPNGTGFNFGTPVEGVLGDLLNPLNEAPHTGPILDMVSPLIKGPVELMAGKDFSTDRPIIDRGEFVDAMVPVVSPLSSISGYSVTGSIFDATLDPQRAVQRGEKEHWLNNALVNFFLGTGMQNYQKPSYLRIGQQEARGRG